MVFFFFFYPICLASQRKTPNEKCLLLLSLMFPLPQWQPMVWLSLAPKETLMGQNLLDGCSLGPGCPRWVGTGSEMLIALFLGTVIWREDGEISFWIYIPGPQFGFMGMDKIVMDALGVIFISILSLQMKGLMGCHWYSLSCFFTFHEEIPVFSPFCLPNLAVFPRIPNV